MNQSSSALKIKSSQIRILRPLPSRNGWAIFISTYFSTISSKVDFGMINKKTTAVRVIPVPGKKVGETVVFGGLLGYAPIMDVNKYSSDLFVKRGGRIPAPIHSLNN